MHFMSKIGKQKKCLENGRELCLDQTRRKIMVRNFSDFLFLYNLAHFFSFIYSNIKGTENFQPKSATILIVTNFSPFFKPLFIEKM